MVQTGIKIRQKKVVPEIGHPPFSMNHPLNNLIIIGRQRRYLTCINPIATYRICKGIFEIEGLALAEREKFLPDASVIEQECKVFLLPTIRVDLTL